MDKKSFLQKLRSGLSFLPKEELERTVAYYDEMISDRIDSGMDEEEAVRAVGDIDSILNSIKNDNNYTQRKLNLNSIDTRIKKIFATVCIVALYIIIFWIIVASVWAVFGIIACVMAGILSAATMSVGIVIMLAGIALMLIAAFLMSIPLVSYSKAGIRYFKNIVKEC